MKQNDVIKEATELEMLNDLIGLQAYTLLTL